MSSAAQIFGAVRAAIPPGTNPFLAIAAVLHKRLYPAIFPAFATSITILHVLYAVQTVLLVASLVIRWKRTPGDMWIFRLTQTARGSYLTPHFAVAWQLSSLCFLILLQPYLVMCREHVQGKEWRGYLGGRTMGFLPAWLSTWLALWSLAVAVCLPRATSRRANHSWLSSPQFLNAHFIGGLILCCISIIAPSIICAASYDNVIAAYNEASALLMTYAPSFSTMTPSSVDLRISQAEAAVNRMFAESAYFPTSFQISWCFWVFWILYSYGVFLVVAISYFGYIRRSMKRVDNNTGSDRERGGLRRTWFFAVGTSVVVTLTGVVYAGAALAVAGWTSETLSNPFMLGTITLVTLYGFGIFGLFASILSLGQSLVGAFSSSSLNSPSSDVTGTKTGHGGTSRVHVSVQTRTEVDRHAADNVVQLELADWQRGEKGEKGEYVDLPI